MTIIQLSRIKSDRVICLAIEILFKGQKEAKVPVENLKTTQEDPWIELLSKLTHDLILEQPDKHPLRISLRTTAGKTNRFTTMLKRSQIFPNKEVTRNILLLE